MQENKNNFPFIVSIFVVVVAIAGVAAILLFQSNQSSETNDNDDEAASNVVELAQSNSNLTTLVDAVLAAELDSALADANANYTVFAPTNSAFSSIQDTVDSLLLPENQNQLAEVLQYHVIDSKVLSSELTDNQVVNTLSGERLEVRIAGDNVYVNDAMVVTADVDASNGVVHVIDKVLVPEEFGNVVDVASSTDDLSTLVAAVQAGELVEALSDENANYTVFAPTNAAFSEIQSSVDSLLEPENKADLANVLQYHVVDSEVFSTELTDGQVITTLSGETLTVEIEAGNVYIAANNSRAQVTTADILTSNGMVHVVDTVLLP